MLDASLALRFKSRRGLPRVRTARNWIHKVVLFHRSAGAVKDARALFFSPSRLRMLRTSQDLRRDEAGKLIATREHAGDFKEW